MNRTRSLSMIATGALALLASGCGTSPFGQPAAPPPPIRPPAFTALGLSAAYLNGDIINGRKARAAKLRAARIRPLSPAAVPNYMHQAEQELRRQTAGIGIDVLRLPDGILIRVPATLTFDQGSAAIKPQISATLTEIARTLKTYNQTYVDVLAHSDTTGSAEGNLALSQKRAGAAAAFLGGRGVARSRIASKGLGETAPLYPVEQTEEQRAANRRVEIRVVPYRG
ncbi:MAG TPA: OmpA family protein [Sphingomicrobium sp.]|nr:OmpA family protein [Sphingomicrobium sp.]